MFRTSDGYKNATKKLSSLKKFVLNVFELFQRKLSFFIVIPPIRNEWESYNPFTNVLWIKYVTQKLLSKLKKSATLSKFLSRVLNYSSSLDIVEKDELFGS